MKNSKASGRSSKATGSRALSMKRGSHGHTKGTKLPRGLLADVRDDGAVSTDAAAAAVEYAKPESEQPRHASSKLITSVDAEAQTMSLVEVGSSVADRNAEQVESSGDFPTGKNGRDGHDGDVPSVADYARLIKENWRQCLQGIMEKPASVRTRTRA